MYALEPVTAFGPLGMDAREWNCWPDSGGNNLCWAFRVLQDGRSDSLSASTCFSAGRPLSRWPCTRARSGYVVSCVMDLRSVRELCSTVFAAVVEPIDLVLCKIVVRKSDGMSARL